MKKPRHGILVLAGRALHYPDDSAVIRSRSCEQEECMPHYPAYTTTVVGAHSVPRWYEALDRMMNLGQLSPGDVADAQFRAMQAAALKFTRQLTNLK